METTSQGPEDPTTGGGTGPDDRNVPTRPRRDPVEEDLFNDTEPNPPNPAPPGG